MVALLLAPKEEAMEQQLEALGERRALASELARWRAAHARGSAWRFHLPVIDLALPR